MTDVVPQPEDLGRMLAAEHAHRGRGEGQALPERRRRLDPPRAQDPQEMSMRKYRHIPLDAAHLGDGPIRTDADLLRSLPLRAPVAPEVPLRPLPEDVPPGPTLVRAVVPLHQIRPDLRPVSEAGQLSRVTGSRQRADEHAGKRPRGK